MAIDPNGLEVLERAQCLALLTTTMIGRVGLSTDALPTVLPVTFALVGDKIVIHANADTRLAGSLDNNVVAFEADGFQESTGRMWSVMARGVAMLGKAGDYDDEVAVSRLPTWGPVDTNTIVTIDLSVLTGRRTPGSITNGRSDEGWTL